MNKNSLQSFIGAIFPISITRANLQASVLGTLGLVASGCFFDLARVVLAVALVLVVASLTGPAFRRAFPFLFDVDSRLRGRIASEIALAADPGEVFEQWQSGPYSVHASAVLLAMQEAINHAVGQSWGPAPSTASTAVLVAAAPTPAPKPQAPVSIPSVVSMAAGTGDPEEGDLSI